MIFPIYLATVLPELLVLILIVILSIDLLVHPLLLFLIIMLTVLHLLVIQNIIQFHSNTTMNIIIVVSQT